MNQVAALDVSSTESKVDAKQQAQKSPRPGNARARRIFESKAGVARLVAGVELLLGAIEEVAWDLRELYEESLRQVASGLGQVKTGAGGARVRASELLVEAKRLGYIAATISTIVLSYRALAIRAAFMSTVGHRKAKDSLHQKNARRFIALAEKLQGGMVKIGQILSARSDLLPKPFTAELARLQDTVQPVPFETVRKILVTAWGAEDLKGVTLSTDPIGSASIAQVHLATLPDGRQVAVKVRRPEIETVLAYDVKSMRRVVDALSTYLPDFNIEPLIDEIAEQLLTEVDFARERASLEAAAAKLKGFPGIRIPAVLAEWSTNNVLVTEFCAGERLDKALANRDDVRREKILTNFAGIYLRQILLWGFFQPDTHPGNFLVQDDDTLVLLDFGCVRELDGDFRKQLARLLQSFIGGDDKTAAEALADLGFETRSGDLGALIKTVRGTLGGLVAGGSQAWDIEKMIASSGELLDQFDRDPVTTIPKEMVMVGRALSTMGGVFFEHKPNLDPMRLLLPVFTEVFAKRNVSVN